VAHRADVDAVGAISALERPRFLYITADIAVTAVMRVPIAK
jgi:hypothetical protein